MAANAKGVQSTGEIHLTDVELELGTSALQVTADETIADMDSLVCGQ